jgi:NAD(P)-dependent dehydrogenase (short-subunit alcohol dehydrogenase family)
MRDLKGKVAVITGGATGIGLALAIELATSGVNHIVIASTNKERLDAAADKIKKAGASALAIVCDVSDKASVQKMHDETIKAFGQVDILVCNSGVTTGGPYLDHRQEDYDWVFGVVLHGTVNCIQVFYPGMVAQKSGHIVITGSQAGMNITWVQHHGPYTAAKSAIMAMGAALRPEAAEHGVGVTNVIVAGTQTEIMQSERSRPDRFGEPQKLERVKRAAHRIPPVDVAKMMVEGIMEDKEWVATHPELKEGTKGYFDRILAAYDH